MKALIVEDDATKFHEVRALLLETGVDPGNIVHASTGLRARELLTEKRFDLLVIDLMLPMHEKGDLDRRGGMNLLTEIKLSERFRRPSHVVALTGFPDLKAEFDTKFNDGTWEIELYDPTDVGWRERLKARAEYIRQWSAASPAYETDLCILTALASPELDAVRSLDWGWSEPDAFDDVSYKYRGTFGANRSAVGISAPRMGMVAAATLATKVICQLRPRLLVMVGICAGLPGECEIGDVILADPAWDWQMGKYSLDKFQIQPDQIPAPAEISQKAALLSGDETLRKLWQSSDRNKPRAIPRLLVGPLASGSAVLADADTAPAVQKQHRKVLGVDMEVYGVYSAARDAANPRPMTFALKGVCDHADQYKNDSYQRYAADMSVGSLALLLSRYEAELFAA